MVEVLLGRLKTYKRLLGELEEKEELSDIADIDIKIRLLRPVIDRLMTESNIAIILNDNNIDDVILICERKLQ